MSTNEDTKPIRLEADFNGLFGELLCLSHSDTAPDENGNPVQLRTGMLVTAFTPDTDDDGSPADLVATGIVERSPWALRCRGSQWVLRIDEKGVYHVRREQ